MSDKQQVLRLIQGSRFEEAKALCLRLCTFDQNDLEAWSLLADINLQLGVNEHAEMCYRQILARAPNDVNACLRLANVLRNQGKIGEAEILYKRALQIDPSLADTYYNLGVAMYHNAKYRESAECHRRAIGLKARFFEAYYGLGLALKAEGAYDEALENFRAATRINPGFADAVAGEAGILERNNEIESAYRLLRPLVDAGTVNTNVVVAFAKLAKHHGCQSEAISAIERCLAQPSLPVSHQLDLHFTLGNLYDQVGEYDKAFLHYQKGNSLKQCTFSPALHKQVTDEFIRAFNRVDLPRFATASNTSELPVFIVGMLRSGTSLVEQILASHPMVFGAGELKLLNMVSSLLQSEMTGGKTYSQFLEGLTQGTLDRIAQQYLNQLAGLSGGAVRVTDKMPYNFMHLGLIQLLFPRARVIHCVRDPLDTCLSCYFQHFSGRHDYAYNLEFLGEFYNQYRRLMEHWQGVLSVPIMEVRYEDLVSNPEPVCRAMVDYCGLTWDDRCLRFHESDRVVKTASYDQVRQPIHTKSVMRSKNYEKFLGPLKATLLNTP